MLPRNAKLVRILDIVGSGPLGIVPFQDLLVCHAFAALDSGVSASPRRALALHFIEALAGKYVPVLSRVTLFFRVGALLPTFLRSSSLEFLTCPGIGHDIFLIGPTGVQTTDFLVRIAVSTHRKRWDTGTFRAGFLTLVQGEAPASKSVIVVGLRVTLLSLTGADMIFSGG